MHKNTEPVYELAELPEFLKCWVVNGTKDNSQLELYIPLPIAEDILIGLIMILVGFIFGGGLGLGGLSIILRKFDWTGVSLTGVGFLFIVLFFIGLRLFIRSIHIRILKKENKAGIWILKTGILIRDEPSQVKYYKWEQLEEAVIENGYMTSTKSPSKHYSLKMLRFDFKINQNHRFRFKGGSENKIVEPTNDLINLQAYDITEGNGSLKKVIKACEKFISIKK